MIQWCTHPDVNTRVGSVEDFLSLLDDVEDELTAPDDVFVPDPLQANRGDRLEGGYVDYVQEHHSGSMSHSFRQLLSTIIRRFKTVIGQSSHCAVAGQLDLLSVFAV